MPILPNKPIQLNNLLPVIIVVELDTLLHIVVLKRKIKVMNEEGTNSPTITIIDVTLIETDLGVETIETEINILEAEIDLEIEITAMIEMITAPEVETDLLPGDPLIELLHPTTEMLIILMELLLLLLLPINLLIHRNGKQLLNNTSVCTTLSSYLYEEAKTANLIQTSAYTTPVKCNVKINQKPHEAIIDSGASISIISYQLVQDLGLKIEQASLSLIIPATGTSSRPLGLIRDLPIEIDGVCIPLLLKVVPATSYLLLLGNDWSKKVEA